MTQPRGQLVQTAAEALRQRIFANAAGTQIGSLRELAQDFGVGIVTIQQAARILEHEGLLEVRRGPGGGYFGRRPDMATLEPVLTAYMRSRPASWPEALDITSLLFTELCAAAATAEVSPILREELCALGETLAERRPHSDIAALEGALQDLLFRMVNRPLFELLTWVTLHFSEANPGEMVSRGLIAREQWQAGRQRIIAAILARDAPLARFEADRVNRQVILQSLAAKREE